MNSFGKSGCLPNIGALDFVRGRTFAHVNIGSFPFNSGKILEAFKIKFSKLLSVVPTSS